MKIIIIERTYRTPFRANNLTEALALLTVTVLFCILCALSTIAAAAGSCAIAAHGLDLAARYELPNSCMVKVGPDVWVPIEEINFRTDGGARWPTQE